MRTAFVIVALIVPAIALALPDGATLSRLLVGTWHGHRHDTQYRADGTWIANPLLYPVNAAAVDMTLTGWPDSGPGPGRAGKGHTHARARAGWTGAGGAPQTRICTQVTGHGGNNTATCSQALYSTNNFGRCNRMLQIESERNTTTTLRPS
jgi:hypothetical protein